MSRFPIAAWYGVGRVTSSDSEDLFRRDIGNMKSLGFSFVKGWVNWRETEPEPFHYSVEYVKRLFKYSSENRMSVILQLYLEFGPDWVGRKYRDSLYESERGDRIIPQGSPGVCLDHPEARKHAERFMKKIASEVKSEKNFYGWDLWSEPHTIQWVFNQSGGQSLYCYCPSSLKRFRTWLKKRYGTVDEVNRSWHRDFGKMEDVQPPRFLVLHYAKENLDWIEFNVLKLKEDLEWRVKTVKSADKEHIITSHSDTTSLFHNPLYGNPNDWEMAKCVDMWGVSLYPKHAGRKPDPVVDGFILDGTRSASSRQHGDFWLGELQGGHGYGGLTLREPVVSADISNWMWQSIAHGVKGINIYHWYPMMWGYESSGYGLVNPDGSLTDRARKAGEIAKIVARNEKLFLEARPPEPLVGILYNIQSYAMMWVFKKDSVDLQSRSLLGLYRAFFRNNIPVDFISLDELERDELRKCRVLFAPASLLITERMAASLRKFVRNGGIFVTDSRFGWVKEDGFIDGSVPAYGMSDIIGGNEDFAFTDDTVEIEITRDTPFGLVKGDRLEGSYFGTGLSGTEKDEVFGVIRHGSRELHSLIARKVGRGMTIYTGTNIANAYETGKGRETTGRLIKGICSYAGISPPVSLNEVEAFPVEARVLKNGREAVLIILNHSSEARSVEAAIEGIAEGSVEDLLTGRSTRISEGKLRIQLEPRKEFAGVVRRA